MSEELPPVIVAYFAGTNAHDVEACAVCFSEKASVRDEGREYDGLAAIRAWKADVIKKYAMSVEIVDAKAGGAPDGYVVTGRVTGTFPGSPIDLDHIFTLRGDRIASLEIR